MSIADSRGAAGPALAQLKTPGEHLVDTSVFCSLTRFGLRRRRHLPATWRDFRAVEREASQLEIAGLLKSAFLVEGPTVCYSLSIWSSKPQMTAFSPRHLEAAHRVFNRLGGDLEAGPELWSTTWRLASVTNNLNWDGLDLRTAILAEGGLA